MHNSVQRSQHVVVSHNQKHCLQHIQQHMCGGGGGPDRSCISARQLLLLTDVPTAQPLVLPHSFPEHATGRSLLPQGILLNPVPSPWYEHISVPSASMRPSDKGANLHTHIVCGVDNNNVMFGVCWVHPPPDTHTTPAVSPRPCWFPLLSLPAASVGHNIRACGGSDPQSSSNCPCHPSKAPLECPAVWLVQGAAGQGPW